MITLTKLLRLPSTALALFLTQTLAPNLAPAQVEGPQPTQSLVTVTSNAPAQLQPSDLTVDLNGKSSPVTSLQPLAPDRTQVAILMDDGLRTSIAVQLDDLRRFIQALPAGTEVFVGYMSNGRVTSAQPFTRNLAAAAASLRIPFGSPGISASPYFCLSEFAKNWPTREVAYGAPPSAPGRKARFVLMLTSGVDPYNGSVSPLNQNSPYVQNAITDAQRAGVIVSSIYYGDAGIRGAAANFSGQSYLGQVAEATGGESYWNGQGNPVSLAPYLARFAKDISQTYVASFIARPSRDPLRLKVKAHRSGLKVRSPALVRTGATVTSSGQ